MMISLEEYIKEYKDKSLKELIKERNELIEHIQKFENQELDSSEYMIHPAPEVVYQCNNEYLIEIIKVINEKFNKQVWDGDATIKL